MNQSKLINGVVALVITSIFVIGAGIFHGDNNTRIVLSLLAVIIYFQVLARVERERKEDNEDKGRS